MNALFGCGFQTSAGRCTVGIYMNVINVEDKTIVLLDTEGLMSVEAGNIIFDNQMASMAALSSHVIIVNHKGEISSNMERLLGMIYYAKMRADKSKFKPSIMFVLRDQAFRDDGMRMNASTEQVMKLKQNLLDAINGLDLDNKECLDDVLNISEKEVFVLPNAFTEDTDQANCIKKWRNKIFADCVFKLRKRLLEHLFCEIKDVDELRFTDMHKLYLLMCSNWATLDKIGDKILKCLNLEEMRMRLRVSDIAGSIISIHKDEFYTTCSKLIEEGSKRLLSDNEDEVDIDIENKFNESHTNAERKLLQTFNDEAKGFSDSLKNEYQDRIKSSLQWVKSFKLNEWKRLLLKRKQKTKLDKFIANYIEKASTILNRNDDFEQFQVEVDELFENQKREFEESLVLVYDSHETTLNSLIKTYNDSIEYVNKKRALDLLAKISDKEIFERYRLTVVNFDELQNGWIKVNQEENVLESGHFDKNVFSKEHLTEINQILKAKIIGEVKILLKDSVTIGNKMSKAIEILRKALFDEKESFILSNETFYRMAELVNDLAGILLAEIAVVLQENKQIAQENDKREYQNYFKDKKQLLHEHFKSKGDSKKQAEIFTADFLSFLYESLFEWAIEQQHNSIDRICYEVLQSPLRLVELAYRDSFGAYDYENVYKYSIDINRYCTETALKHTKEKVKSCSNDLSAQMKEEASKLLDFLENSFTDADNQLVLNHTNLFINELNKLSSSDLIRRFFNDSRKHLVLANITDFTEFLNGFKAVISEHKQRLLIEMLNKKRKIIELEEKCEHTKMIKYFKGCNSSCPGCGSKCHLEKNHFGSHKSNKHLLKAFHRWSYIETNEPVIRFCWEETAFLIEGVILSSGKNYENFKTYLTVEHKDWLHDAEENYLLYDSHEHLLKEEIRRYKYEAMKAWMNTRKPLIKLKAIMIDKSEYEKEWLCLIDHDKMLDQEFEP